MRRPARSARDMPVGSSAALLCYVTTTSSSVFELIMWAHSNVACQDLWCWKGRTYSARHLTMVYRCSPVLFALVATVPAPLFDR